MNKDNKKYKMCVYLGGYGTSVELLSCEQYIVSSAPWINQHIPCKQTESNPKHELPYIKWLTTTCTRGLLVQHDN